MKWENAARIFGELPWLSDQVGVLSERSCTAKGDRRKEKTLLRQWVEDKVRYIAFRPFERLNLALKPVWEKLQLESMWQREGDEVQYDVDYLIVVRSEHRILHGVIHLGLQLSGRSIRDGLEVPLRTHRAHAKPEEGKLIFVVVVQKTRIQSRAFGVLLEAYDIYRFPDDFVP